LADDKIAHLSLKGEVTAEEFTEGTLKTVVTCPVTDLRLQASATRTDRQILFGHPVLQLENKRGLARDETSGYVGYVNTLGLTDYIPPTHRVAVRASLLFRAPDIKSYNPYPLSMGALVRVGKVDGKFAQIGDRLFAIADHLVPVDHKEPDLAASAIRLLGTPYLWGGNSAFGIDCSGLVQMSCQMAGLPCPGDSDQQMSLGASVTDSYQRNDLVFWKGHVALVVDPETLIHANAHAMAVSLEPIADAIARIEKAGDGPVTAHRRLPALSG
jgi:hypothetical protein